MEAEEQMNNRSEKKHMRDDYKRLKGLETCSVMVFSVLVFGIDCINKLKVKDLRVLLHYYFGSETLKGIQKKRYLWRLLKILYKGLGQSCADMGWGGVGCLL